MVTREEAIVRARLRSRSEEPRLITKEIGIIGGAGHAACAHIHSRLIAHAQRLGARRDADFPTIRLISQALPAFDARGYRPKDRLTVIVEAERHAQTLRDQGCELILPACNTLNALLDAEDIISLPHCAAAQAATSGVQRAVLLTSATSRRERLVADAMEQAGVEAIVVDDPEQRALDAAISCVIAGETAAAGKLLRAVSAAVLARADGDTALVIACTELSVVRASIRTSRAIIDSAQTAVERTLHLAICPDDVMVGTSR